MTAMLEVERLEKSFGGVRAVDGFSFHVDRGETLGIIGPNGAGKTTVFNLITRFYTPDSGRIRFMGKLITHLPPYRLARLGIARTFQNLRLFKDLTVLENITSAHLTGHSYSPLAGIFRTGKHLRIEREAQENATMLVDFLGLDGKEQTPAGSLPYGEQRRLEIARALATRPKLLLIDEPGAGMNPREIKDLVATLRQVKEAFGLTIVMIEHQMGLVMNISDRIVVMDFGEKIMEGTPMEVKKDRRVIEAYLGEEPV
ncbi:MAG: ABC transporter ATP-binding protein [Syntrophorhabdus sp.]|nr:ABC transporter ATP-binding protein [Syntrophorhabdus sp.]